MSPDQTIGSVVADDYRTAAVFSNLGIDFCCKGGRSISEVCAQKGIQPDILIEALWKAKSQPEQPQDRQVQQWTATELAAYIERQHHHYVRENTPVLTAYLKKVASVHGDRHPELHVIFALFTESSAELLSHMIKEETVLFPAIKRMERMVDEGATLDEPFFFGSVENPIAAMRNEHEAEGDRFAEMARLSNSYAPPEDACNTYKVAFAKLQEFEADLHRHIHLENNILFHKAIQLQAQLSEYESEQANQA